MASVRQATANGANGAALPHLFNLSLACDDHELAERIVAALEDAGIELTPDGEEVLITAHNRVDAGVCAQIRELNRNESDIAVVLIVGDASPGDVRRALQAGAHAVVLEPLIDSALVPSIRAALAGQLVMPARARRGGQPGVLTTREKQILGQVVMGMSNAEIATKLFLAESTVKSHLSSAFAKLGVSSRSEAANVILDPQSGAGLGILTIPTK
jgi:DNA-binding NarL/FixJ family response regulator